MFIEFIILSSMISINYIDVFLIHRENNINSNCDFDIIRIKKQDVLCNDYGVYKKYCNHYSIPDEFTIKKEIGMQNKEQLNIKPDIMYEETYDNKIVLADFYYIFNCDRLDNEPRLYLKIIPISDKLLGAESVELLIGILLLIPILLIIIIFFPYLLVGSNFTTGFILGTIIINSYSKKIYCV